MFVLFQFKVQIEPKKTVDEEKEKKKKKEEVLNKFIDQLGYIPKKTSKIEGIQPQDVKKTIENIIKGKYKDNVQISGILINMSDEEFKILQEIFSGLGYEITRSELSSEYTRIWHEKYAINKDFKGFAQAYYSGELDKQIKNPESAPGGSTSQGHGDLSMGIMGIKSITNGKSQSTQPPPSTTSSESKSGASQNQALIFPTGGQSTSSEIKGALSGKVKIGDIDFNKIDQKSNKHKIAVLVEGGEVEYNAPLLKKIGEETLAELLLKKINDITEKKYEFVKDYPKKVEGTQDTYRVKIKLKESNPEAKMVAEREGKNSEKWLETNVFTTQQSKQKLNDLIQKLKNGEPSLTFQFNSGQNQDDIENNFTALAAQYSYTTDIKSTLMDKKSNLTSYAITFSKKSDSGGSSAGQGSNVQEKKINDYKQTAQNFIDALNEIKADLENKQTKAEDKVDQKMDELEIKSIAEDIKIFEEIKIHLEQGATIEFVEDTVVVKKGNENLINYSYVSGHPLARFKDAAMNGRNKEQIKSILSAPPSQSSDKTQEEMTPEQILSSYISLIHNPPKDSSLTQVVVQIQNDLKALVVADQLTKGEAQEIAKKVNAEISKKDPKLRIVI
ncbi:MAG: hypothetical protein N3G74_00860 [Candidatus Micrarchaeota archaeon]|nr:hypothetical protein [Candidatus Micrarchaeota archaeon]